MGHDGAADRLPLADLVDNPAPVSLHLGACDPGIDHGPPIAVAEQPQVDVVEGERERHPHPADTVRDLEYVARVADWGEGVVHRARGHERTPGGRARSAMVPEAASRPNRASPRLSPGRIRVRPGASAGASGAAFVDEPHRLLPALDAGEVRGLPRSDQLDLDRNADAGAKMPGDLPRQRGAGSMPGRTSTTTVSAARPSRRASRQTNSPVRAVRSERCAPTAWG